MHRFSPLNSKYEIHVSHDHPVIIYVTMIFSKHECTTFTVIFNFNIPSKHEMYHILTVIIYYHNPRIPFKTWKVPHYSTYYRCHSSPFIYEMYPCLCNIEVYMSFYSLKYEILSYTTLWPTDTITIQEITCTHVTQCNVCHYPIPYNKYA